MSAMDCVLNDVLNSDEHSGRKAGGDGPVGQA